ncbi:MAG: M20/M25/M40 family metallo-hydrolase [Candidatus Hodarchaeales archaeon]
MGRTSMIDLLKELISFKTESHALNDEKEEKKKCSDYLSAHLSSCGFQVEVNSSTNPRNNVTSFNVIAKKILSDNYKTLALIGHFDVVPAIPNDWDHDPYALAIEGNRGYGRGSMDMKGSLVAGLKALERIIEEKIPINLMVLLTSDEEAGGSAGMGKVTKKMKNGELKLPDYVINADGNGNKVINRRRNVFLVKLTVPAAIREIKGDSAFMSYRSTTIFERETSHAAYFMPYVDTHSLLKVSQYLNTENVLVVGFEKESKFIKNNVLPSEVMFELIIPDSRGKKHLVDMNLNLLLRNLIYLSRLPIPSGFSCFGVNITPNVLKTTETGTELEIDIRANLKDSKIVRKKIEEFMKLRKIPVEELKVLASPSPLETAEDSELVRTAVEVQKHLLPDLDAGPYEMQGASDSRFFTPLGVDTIDYGVAGSNLHGINEYVELESLEIARKFYYNLIKKLANAR